MEYRITNHARERFVERFSEEKSQFNHLSECRANSCEVCRELTFEFYEAVKAKKDYWDENILSKLRFAEEIKIFQNDSLFMDNMYSRYGYHRYQFLVEEPILFVLKEEGGKRILLTCVDVNYPVNGSTVIVDFLRRPKFKKRKVFV